ncbi:amidohydrolase [Massilia niabensis]|uniref:Amidohydrolase n=1 Tax=Massilia niabensis TaxID=544910 RepID=A0ABW0L6N6_9BURK
MPVLKNLIHRKGVFALLSAAALFGTPFCSAADAPFKPTLDAIYPSLDALYQDLHRHPELSLQEEKTAAKMAAQLRKLGLQVTERVGGYGVVGVLRNGDGPTVMVRTDMDALPIKEQTGLPYASTVVAKAGNGDTTSVMHACGHDIHMTSWVGAAAILAANKAGWRGTVVFVGQPAEEILQGAKAMLKDGLLTRFPKPDFVLGIHDTNLIPAGQVGIVSGPASAASNSVDITFYGKGGHGAAPHLGKDPVLIAARAVVTLQSIVSREVSPFEPAIVTVGTFHAGTKRNVIPDEAKLELTVRSYKSEVQQHMLEAIARIAKAESAAAGTARQPLVTVDPKEASDVVINDPALAARLGSSLKKSLGEANVVPIAPSSASEDFGEFGRVAKVPSIQLRLGMVEPKEYAAAKAAGKQTPGSHTANFAPDRERTIRTGVAALAASVMELLKPAM